MICHGGTSSNTSVGGDYAYAADGDVILFIYDGSTADSWLGRVDVISRPINSSIMSIFDWPRRVGALCSL